MKYPKPIRQWQIVGVHLGEAEVHVSPEMSYSKKEIVEDLKGVNLGAEMSRYHRCLVLLPTKFNAGDSILIAPFSTYKSGDENKASILIIYYEELTKKFINHTSVLHLTRLRTISRKRITKYYGFLPHVYSRKVIGKLQNIFKGNN